jgi:hypothetical protein
MPCTWYRTVHCMMLHCKCRHPIVFQFLLRKTNFFSFFITSLYKFTHQESEPQLTNSFEKLYGFTDFGSATSVVDP